MKKLISRNPFGLAIIALVLNIIIGIISWLITVKVFKLEDASVAYSSGITMLILGQLYAQKYSEEPSEGLSNATSAIFIIFQLIIGVVIYWDTLKEEINTNNSFIIGLGLLFIILICFLLFKWAFRFGARKYLHAIRKKSQRNSK